MESKEEILIHQAYLKRCYELAIESAAQGESPVGSLIVLEGTIIAQSTENSKKYKDISRHAEAEAIRMALKSLQTPYLENTSLYTSHEPCILCSYMIRHYRIARVIYVEAVGELGGIESSLPLLTLPLEKWISPPEIIKIVLE